MKIGILTQPLHINYGGLLQNYALQKVLKDMGHDVLTFNIQDHHRPWIREQLSKIKNKVCGIIIPSLRKNVYHTTQRQEAVIRQHTNHFIDKYIRITLPIHRKEDFANCAKLEQFDGFVVGSDQVWRPCYNDFITSMFLDFVKDDNIKKVAYAASFGTSKWEYTKTLTQKCRNLVRKFDIITVREFSGISLCKNYLGVEAKHVLDPTMLLVREDYEKLVHNEKEPPHKGNLFYYFLDPNEAKANLVKEITLKGDMTPFSVLPKYQPQQRTKAIVENKIEDCIYPSVTSWVRAFMDANIVIGDSFHCAVFSIIFNKTFWVVSNNNRGNTRIKSLLKMFNIEDRLIDENNFNVVNMEGTINWEPINITWSKSRLRCINLLKNNLK